MSNDDRRKRLEGEYEEALMKLIMDDVAEYEGQLLLDESKRLRESGEFESSPEAVQRFTKRLDAEFAKRRRKGYTKHVVKALRVTAACLLVIIIAFATAMTTAQAFRAKVMNLLISIYPEYTAFKLVGSDTASKGNPVINWRNSYVPTYAPEGYEVDSFEYGAGYKRITFVNAQDQTFITYRELDESNSPLLDTENASRLEVIYVNNHSTTLVVKNGVVSLVWEMDNLMFFIHTRTSVDTAIKVAEGVKFVK